LQVLSGVSCKGDNCPSFPDWALRRVLSDFEMQSIEQQRLQTALSVVGENADRVACPKVRDKTKKRILICFVILKFVVSV
jgi:hypothetical protein